MNTKQFPEIEGDKKVLLSFLCELFWRVPHMVHAVNDPQKMMDNLRKMGADMSNGKESVYKELVAAKGFAHALSFQPSSNILFEKIQNIFEVCLCVAENSLGEFILGDKYGGYTTPLTGEEINSKRQKEGASFEVYNICDFIFCPISAGICVVFMNKSMGGKNKFSNFSVNNISAKCIDNINLSIAKVANDRFFGQSEELLGKILKQIKP